ncbi:MAG TPA: ATP-binding protein [Armatimonadota bacterium]|jgi:two-component system sensor histidine kinase KdpD
MRQRLITFTRHGELLGLGIVALAIVISYFGRSYVAKEYWVIFFLLLIVLVASVSGTRAAVLVSVLSLLVWDFFFLSPFNILSIIEPKDWIPLVTFLIVGSAIGIQTGRTHERAVAALSRERETALLYQLSASLVSVASTPAMLDSILHSVCVAMDAPDAALFLQEEDDDALIPWRRSDLRDVPIAPEVLAGVQRISARKDVIDLPAAIQESALPHLNRAGRAARPDIFLPVRTPARFKGVLYVATRTDGDSYTVQEMQLLAAMTNLIATFLERQQLTADAAAVQALREADRLKSTLVSSVSHELKTPLAAINATVTNLLAPDVAWSPDTISHELETIRESTARLSDSIGSLVDLSRLQADGWKPNKDRYELAEIIGAAVKSFSKAQRARLTFRIPDDLPQISVDFQQWTRACQHVLENALTYAPPPSPVEIGAAAAAGEMRIWIADSGPGIPLAERERIFEQFYRGSTAQTVQGGTGLGLAITAEIVREHGGRIVVDDVQPHGARFLITLPCERSTHDAD